MKFVTFEKDAETKIGVMLESDSMIVDLHQVQLAVEGKADLPNTLLACIQLGEAFVERSKRLMEWAEENRKQEYVYPLDQVTLLAPIPRPSKNIVCLGKNYAAHALEMGSADDIPKYPMVFSKAPTSVTGPYSPIYRHKHLTDSLDYEGELAVVIGKRGFRINKEEALDYVFGYTIINDVTARDLQKRHQQFLLGKSLDTGCPMGPAIVHKKLIPDPHNLTVKTTVNGEVRQNGNTREFIFDIPTMISILSQGMTLEPGDIIATGTPAGVGSGFNPPRFLQTGDVIEVEIKGIGKIRNTVIDQ